MAAYAERWSADSLGGVKEQRPAPRLGRSPAPHEPPLIGKLRGAEYQTSAEYQNAPRSDFNTAPPQVLVTGPPAATSPVAAATAPDGEAVIRKDGKPVVGITYPSDWKQITGDRYVSAVSADGQAYSMIVAVEGAADNQAGIAKVKQGLEKYLQDIKYDNLTKTKRGALVLTGTGKGKKSGVAVVFAAGVFDAGCRATRRGGICRRCPHRRALQRNGPPDLPDDSRRRPARREEVGSADEAGCQSGRRLPGPTVHFTCGRSAPRAEAADAQAGPHTEAEAGPPRPPGL